MLAQKKNDGFFQRHSTNVIFLTLTQTFHFKENQYKYISRLREWHLLHLPSCSHNKPTAQSLLILSPYHHQIHRLLTPSPASSLAPATSPPDNCHSVL